MIGGIPTSQKRENGGRVLSDQSCDRRRMPCATVQLSALAINPKGMRHNLLTNTAYRSPGVFDPCRIRWRSTGPAGDQLRRDRLADGPDTRKGHQPCCRGVRFSMGRAVDGRRHRSRLYGLERTPASRSYEGGGRDPYRADLLERVPFSQPVGVGFRGRQGRPRGRDCRTR